MRWLCNCCAACNNSLNGPSKRQTRSQRCPSTPSLWVENVLDIWVCINFGRPMSKLEINIKCVALAQVERSTRNQCDLKSTASRIGSLVPVWPKVRQGSSGICLIDPHTSQSGVKVAQHPSRSLIEEPTSLSLPFSRDSEADARRSTISEAQR